MIWRSPCGLKGIYAKPGFEKPFYWSSGFGGFQNLGVLWGPREMCRDYYHDEIVGVPWIGWRLSLRSCHVRDSRSSEPARVPL